MAILVFLWSSPMVGDRIKEWRERARPLPPLGSPNVLLIVLDTVAAGHLSLYGYPGPRVRPSSNSPKGGYDSIPPGLPLHGRCPHMRQCSQEDGCMNCP